MGVEASRERIEASIDMIETSIHASNLASVLAARESMRAPKWTSVPSDMAARIASAVQTAASISRERSTTM
jgi:hypothetical protein